LSQFVCEDSPEPSHTDVLMPRKFSQLEYYTALRGSGVVEEQALVIAQQASNIQEDILSSMSNEFRKLEKKIEGVESKIEGVKTELKAKIKEAKGELKAEIKEAKGELKAEIKEAKGELDKVPGYILATPAATVALLGIGTAFWKAFFGPEKI